VQGGWDFGENPNEGGDSHGGEKKIKGDTEWDCKKRERGPPRGFLNEGGKKWLFSGAGVETHWPPKEKGGPTGKK